ncbi:hypothetical protein IPH19_01375 [Candidatus Uhrbacteria bacterium]|nr:MAG: hypothetical protein IPH19_01375 [Candidatus Uhrbacteria bacterium]
MSVLEKGGREIVLAGTKHTRNPDDRQILDLGIAFKNSLKSSERGFVLCLEGDKLNNDEEMLDASISRIGEQAVLIDIAMKERINFFNIEPSFARINSLAIEVFADRKALAGWAFLNFLSGAAKDGRIGIEKKELLIKVLGSIGGQYQIAESGLACFEVLRDYLQEAGVINFNNFDQIFEVDIEIERIVEAQKPTNGPYVTNEAAVCINLARDFGLMENALRIFEEMDKNLFVWQGLNHVISQLPAYQHLGFKEIK